VKFLSYSSGDGDELMGIEAVVLTTIFPRWWETGAIEGN